MMFQKFDLKVAFFSLSVFGESAEDGLGHPAVTGRPLGFWPGSCPSAPGRLLRLHTVLSSLGDFRELIWWQK